MNESYFIFEWILNKEAESRIVEKIPISDYENYISENGTIAEEIFLTCALRTVAQNSRFLSFDPFELFSNFSGESQTSFREIVANYSHQDNLSQDNYISINFDLLEKLALTYVRDTCQKHPQGVEMTGENSRVMRIFNEIIVEALTPHDDKRMKTVDVTPHNDAEDNGLKEFRELIEEIKKSNIKQAYIREDTKERKCIALYKKWAGQELTIAFSGNYDCTPPELYDFFGVKITNRRYADYEKIAKAIGANLAGTSCSVSRYKFGGNKNNDTVRYDLVNNIMHRKRTRDDYYSCCERKIFAFLDDNNGVYSGKLFVKYPPCQECSISILHHLTLQGKLFSMFVGFPKS